jgi:Putative peptidoglycan binding domain
MTIRNLLLEGLSLLAVLPLGGPAAAQTAPSAATAAVKSIDITDARPIPGALDIIEQRYDVAIDYVDAEYSNPQDLQTVTSVRGMPVKKPFPVPRVRALNLYYQEMNGEPIGGITALIQSVLTQFADDGGPVFAVREFTMPYGPRWEVYPTEARDLSGALVAQPDVLDAVIQIPTEKRTSGEMVAEIGKQLSATWGRKFNIALFTSDVPDLNRVERGAENVTALTALLRLTGQNVLRAFYMPDNNQYYVSIGPRPRHQPARPLPPVPRAAPAARTRSAPVAVWLRRSLYYKGKMDIQTALSQAGFLHTAATGEWDAPTLDAISRFQSANHLEVTGRINAATIQKLEPFLPQLQSHPTPHGWANGMYPALAQWLQSNPQGWTDIQTALAKKGFYTGSTSGMLDLKTHNALKAFQASNGLRQTGVFDRPTAEQLAPFIPKPGEEPPVATR